MILTSNYLILVEVTSNYLILVEGRGSLPLVLPTRQAGVRGGQGPAMGAGAPRWELFPGAKLTNSAVGGRVTLIHNSEKYIFVELFFGNQLLYGTFHFQFQEMLSYALLHQDMLA